MPDILMCMTPGVSLKTWQKVGTIHRETALMRHLAENGWRVRVLTFRTETAKTYDLPNRISTIYFPHGRLLDILPYSHFWLRSRIDLIQTNQSYRSWQYARAASKWKKPFLLRCGWVYGEGLETTQGLTDETRHIQSLEREGFRQATMVEVTAEHLKEWVIERYGVDPLRVHVIPNHVDTDLFRRLSVQRLDRSVVSVGNLHSVKRFELLIRACAAAKVKVLTIFGDGIERQNLIGLARGLNLDLQLPGVVENDQLPELLQQHQLFVITSMREGHPKALIEAMACEMPCLGVDVVGIRSCILQSNGGGLLVESNVESLADTLSMLCDDSIQRRALGRRAREYVISSMGIDTIISKRRELMEQCVNGWRNE